MFNLWKHAEHWLNNKRAERINEDYENGWDFAAGRLLEGELPESVGEYVDATMPAAFNRGIGGALVAWKNMKDFRP